ncbi:hypothetical protein [Streptomyces fuscigenes]|uniref:hypothetical protein n=1 Tax=Streptomyces fuscigenes TaxID=1528880 RepID=UPI001F2BD52A|nr:hypothetical protein [Streptomyces fuscigenes]MCF3960488.1 hypothetical protein [Streptomyces fuscigenes]
MTAEAVATPHDLAREFADKLTSLTRGVLGEGAPRFHAVNVGSRVRVSPLNENEVEANIPVSINGEPRLELLARYYCCWDGSSTFLATDKADIHVFYRGIADPLVRFEYVRSSKEPPGAHIQVHAHRDEMAYLLRLADAGRPKRGMKHDKLPRLSEMHLPVGGHRMRPALEDVLMFLKRELAIDTAPGWQAVINERLQEWRIVQLKSAVRDHPEAAAEILRVLGYEVTEPKIGTQRVDPDSVKLFWP